MSCVAAIGRKRKITARNRPWDPEFALLPPNEAAPNQTNLDVTVHQTNHDVIVHRTSHDVIVHRTNLDVIVHRTLAHHDLHQIAPVVILKPVNQIALVVTKTNLVETKKSSSQTAWIWVEATAQVVQSEHLPGFVTIARIVREHVLRKDGVKTDLHVDSDHEAMGLLLHVDSDRVATGHLLHADLKAVAMAHHVVVPKAEMMALLRNQEADHLTAKADHHSETIASRVAQADHHGHHVETLALTAATAHHPSHAERYWGSHSPSHVKQAR
jgi:hypothetical protein